MTTYTSRTEIPDHEKWNLTHIYPHHDAWKEDFNQVVSDIHTLGSYNDNIHNAEQFYGFLSEQEALMQRYTKLYVFAMLQNDEDTRQSSSQTLLDQVQQLGVKISSATSFFMPYLLELEEETLKRYIEEVPALQYFEKDLLESYRYKTHVLTKEKEEVLSQLGDALASPKTTFGMINNADIVFGDVTNENGEKVPLTRGMFAKIMESADRDKRKEAYKAYYKPYVQMKNTIASTLSSAVKNNVTLAKMRNYPSALEKALFGDNVPVSVYENLIETTKKNIEPLHRYMKVRKEKLGVEELRAYDLSAPLVKDVREDISYEEAYQTMLESLKPLGDEYITQLKAFKDAGVIDVRETPGKRSGAYNIGLYGVHPYVLLNHRDNLDSLFTLAHEMGHCMHSHYSSLYQPRISASYSIFVAEVASTVNEVLLIHHLLDTTTDKKMRKHLLNHFIDQFKGTFFTQVMFAEFEKTVHEKVENGESLNAEVFNEMYEKLFRTYNGDDLVFEEEVKFGWSRIPHFYRPFYVYKYATGYVSAIHIAERLLKGDSETLEAYLTFLQSGSSEYPLDLLKATGVDLLSPEPVESAMKTFARLVDEFGEE
ncbi:oligoendopeptidase F [Metabacillus iocasae]|uniref:Oligopeptidase F n=1 Tax=Priestia iocasae TaxID=2291674 RepID=A0ABS2QSI1_9BACI|nr:oligoendopeptidase F [Metabacillus iocasae]MBM7702414.1 oligoendopeptidase F [Metabacillus iocasae]